MLTKTVMMKLEPYHYHVNQNHSQGPNIHLEVQEEIIIIDAHL